MVVSRWIVAFLHSIYHVPFVQNYILESLELNSVDMILTSSFPLRHLLGQNCFTVGSQSQKKWVRIPQTVI